METKKSYEQPQSAVMRVELESPICSGSAVIENPAATQGVTNYEIEDQKVNTTFDYTPTKSGWDSNEAIN